MPPSQCSWINQIGIQCGQPEGHTWGHGNGLLTTPRDEWKLPYPSSAESTLPPLSVADAAKLREEFLKEWTLGEGDAQCLWQGSHGRCILKLGHFPWLGHKELENGG
jgi:hypothetical protein